MESQGRDSFAGIRPLQGSAEACQLALAALIGQERHTAHGSALAGHRHVEHAIRVRVGRRLAGEQFSVVRQRHRRLQEEQPWIGAAAALDQGHASRQEPVKQHRGRRSVSVG